TASGYFQLGQLHELLATQGKFADEAARARAWDDALAAYKKGAEKAKGDDKLLRRFKAAERRVEQLKADQPRGGRAAEVGRGLGRAEAALVLLLLPALAADDDTEEAGYFFWDALEKARKRQMTGPEGAIELLKKAEAAHKARRLLRRGKAQNPESDPTEQIFV